jgi:hypothetical protein
MILSMRDEITVSEYEGLVLGVLRRELMEEPSWLRSEGYMIRVEDVRLDAAERERMAVVLFRDEARPRCLFGWRFPSNDESETDPDARRPWGLPQAEVWAGTIVLTNFEEQIVAGDLGLPSECDPGGITWVGAYKPRKP